MSLELPEDFWDPEPPMGLSYIWSTKSFTKVHAIMDGFALHGSYPKDPEPWTLEDPLVFGKAHAYRLCGACRALNPEVEALYQHLRRWTPPDAEAYQRVDQVRRGNYMDHYGAHWICTEPGKLHKLGKDRSACNFEQLAPFVRIGDLPDLTDPVTVWAVGTRAARPVAWMDLEHIQNALGSISVRHKCVPALVARESLLLRRLSERTPSVVGAR